MQRRGEREVDGTRSLVHDGKQNLPALCALIRSDVGGGLQMARSDCAASESLRELHAVVDGARLGRSFDRAFDGRVDTGSAAVQVDSCETSASGTKHVIRGP